MVEFKIFGIPVRVEPSFWFTLGLFGFVRYGLKGENSLLLIALFLLAAFVSILIHEMGHAMMIRKYKLPTQVVLSNFGGYAMYPAGILNRLQSFLVTAAGPGLQILVAVIAIFSFGYNLEPMNMLPVFGNIFIEISIFWALLNCLPVLPLDGGQMLAAILGPKRRKAVHITSVVIAAALAIGGFLVGQFFIAIFMGMFGYQNFQAWQQLNR